MSFISIFRLAALSLSLFLGLVVLGLTAHWIQVTTTVADETFDFEIVAIVAGILTVLTLPVMLVVGLIRRGAFTSMIAVELSTLTVLWVLFLTVGALTAQWNKILYPFGCGDTFDLNINQQGWCREFLAIMGSSFVVWIVLLLYTVTLLVMALIGKSNGHTVWTVSVEEAFPNVQNGNGLSQPAGDPVYLAAPGAYPPMQQDPMKQQYVGAPTGQSGLPQV
ncbi:hypothetical protein E4T56_gene8201 [Termitomyces sp. T112]|nr:hypothetical protein C0989_012641 [Termitomyces sp. Mn162]KAG5733803.1 hypothetical protein E4T56_gene8201 [Termitomyces sp. T112]KAH0585039.1 hypothetical protein H2248_008307 [Termitomyces sp. 'cryptogamus']KNZ72168.1 hypothetical protein J132_04449 [Termitomyces sp. J132]